MMTLLDVFLRALHCRYDPWRTVRGVDTILWQRSGLGSPPASDLWGLDKELRGITPPRLVYQMYACLIEY